VADAILGVAVGILEVLVDAVLGLWSKAGGVVWLSRIRRSEQAMRRSGQARGVPRPTFSRASDLVIRGGFH
jgi:hypothetical protein